MNMKRITKFRNKCIWVDDSCKNAKCSDAADSILFNTHNKCNHFFNSFCTVIEIVDIKGCMPRKVNCNDYTSPAFGLKIKLMLIVIGMERINV